MNRKKTLKITFIILSSIIISGAIFYFIIFHTTLFMSQKDQVFLKMTRSRLFKDVYEAYESNQNICIEANISLDALLIDNNEKFQKLLGSSLNTSCIVDEKEQAANIEFTAKYNGFKILNGNVYLSNEAFSIDAPDLINGYITYRYETPLKGSIFKTIINEYQNAEFKDDKEDKYFEFNNKKVKAHKYSLILNGKQTKGKKISFYMDKKGNIYSLKCNNILNINIQYDNSTITTKVEANINNIASHSIKTALIIELKITPTEQKIQYPSGKEYIINDFSIADIKRAFKQLKKKINKKGFFNSIIHSKLEELL